MSDDQQAPERIRLLVRDGQFAREWYYTDAAVGPCDAEFVYDLAPVAQPPEQSDVEKAKEIVEELNYNIRAAGHVGCNACDGATKRAIESIASALTAAQQRGSELQREALIEFIADFDGREWCKCSECQADAHAHGVDTQGSLANLVNAIRAAQQQ